ALNADMQSRIASYHTLAKKAVKNDDSSTGVFAALERFFYKLEFLLKNGYLPATADTKDDSVLPPELQKLRSFLRAGNTGETFVLQRNATERYCFSWQNNDKLTVTKEECYYAPAGVRTGYVDAEKWRTHTNTQNVEPDLVLQMFDKKLFELITAKLHSIEGKLNNLWPASKTNDITKMMNKLKTQLTKEVKNLTKEQLSYVDLYLDRVIFMFAIRHLSKIDGLIQKHRFILCPRIDVTEKTFVVKLTYETNNKVESLAEYSLQVINQNLSALVGCCSQMNADNPQQKLLQLLCGLVISMSLTAVSADMTAVAITENEQRFIDELIGSRIDNARRASFLSILYQLGAELDTLSKYNDFEYDKEKKDAWHTIYDWIDKSTKISYCSDVAIGIPNRVMSAICFLLNIRLSN
ncbi:TPA: DUF2713 family protein, partial [Escherichia coli]|nr:DUF2713 family protein [Escherichia coli]HAJ7257802.1 DUF2713 family protein [Escherichia coli]HAJ7262618.1 DUF2713 family protein [Escherichia coli]HBA2641144.1 DUF2713 family protein [Escherichia coli]